MKRKIVKAPAGIADNVIRKFCNDHNISLMDVCKNALQAFPALCVQCNLKPEEIFEKAIKSTPHASQVIGLVYVLGLLIEEAMIANGEFEETNDES
jgi:hypothetical protein